MAKGNKLYAIGFLGAYSKKETVYVGTLQELIKAFSYTLECGASWQHESGCKKVNVAPKTIRGLLTALENSVWNTQGSCYSRDSYWLSDVDAENVHRVGQ